MAVDGVLLVFAVGVVPSTVVAVESLRRVPHPGFARVRDDIVVRVPLHNALEVDGALQIELRFAGDFYAITDLGAVHLGAAGA